MRRMGTAAVLLWCALSAFGAEKSLTIYVSSKHPFSLRYDPAVWTSSDGSASDVDLILQHHSGKAVAAVFAFEGDLTLEQLRDNALKNGRAAAPDLKVVSESRLKKDAADLLDMRMTGTNADGPVTHFGRYWAGGGQSIQIVASTQTKDLPAVQKDIESLIDGLSISIQGRVIESRRNVTVDFAPAKWTVTDDGTDDGNMTWSYGQGEGVAIANAAKAQIAKGGLRAYVIEQAKALAPDVRVVREEQKTVNGSKVSMLQLEGKTTDGVDAVMLGYFFYERGVYVQAVTMTSRPRFQELRADMVEFLDGLQIHLPPE